MKIEKCSNCGHIMLSLGRKKCLKCMNASAFQVIRIISVHEKASTAYEKVESFIENGRFVDALDMTYSLLEWSPDEATIYWMRLLARMKCSSVYELIAKGFDVDGDPDMYNAIRFAPDNEKIAYSSVCDATRIVQTALIEAIKRRNNKSVAATSILQLRDNLDTVLGDSKARVFGLWKELAEVEAKMFKLKADCTLLAKEQQTALSKSLEDAEAFRFSSVRAKEYTEKEYSSALRTLKIISERSNSGVEMLSRLREHSAPVAEFQDMESKRSAINSQLSKEISALKEYSKSFRRKIAEINTIEECHNAAIVAAENFNFSDGARIISTPAFSEVLRKAGL